MNPQPQPSFSGLMLRWLNVQCYEIKLPNGKVILFDPQLSSPLPEDQKAKYYKIPESYKLTKESVERADYLILNHTHCDHLVDLGYFVKKFNPVVICHQCAAYETAKAFDIPFTSIFAMNPDESCEFADFHLDTLHGSHMPQPFTYASMPNIMKVSYGMDGAGMNEIGHLGGLFNINYMLTTKENLRIGFFAGRMDHMSHPQLNRMASLQPNILIRQIPVVLLENPAEIFAREMLLTGAQLMLPMHHEFLDIAKPDFLADIFHNINQILAENKFHGQAFLPQRGAWYQLQTSILPV